MKTSILLFTFLINAFSVLSKPQTFETRVTGGEDAAPGRFPHQISVQRNRMIEGVPPKYEHFCGGSILSKTWIITAAHCANSKFYKGEYLAVASLYSLNDLTDSQSREIVEMITHPGWDGKGPNDIALMKLEESLEFTLTVQPITLPKQDEEFEGEAIFTGWGSVQAGSPVYPNNLQRGILKVISDKECLKEFNLPSIDFLSDSTLCTIPTPYGHSFCDYDNGGPLIQRNYLIGVASRHMKPCGFNDLPSIFAQVSKFTDFIRGIVTDIDQY